MSYINALHKRLFRLSIISDTLNVLVGVNALLLGRDGCI
jgi:hypothetical protein